MLSEKNDNYRPVKRKHEEISSLQAKKASKESQIILMKTLLSQMESEVSELENEIKTIQDDSDKERQSVQAGLEFMQEKQLLRGADFSLNIQDQGISVPQQFSTLKMPALPVLPEPPIPLETSYDSDDSGIDETQAPKPRDTSATSSSIPRQPYPLLPSQKIKVSELYNNCSPTRTNVNFFAPATPSPTRTNSGLPIPNSNSYVQGIKAYTNRLGISCKTTKPLSTRNDTDKACSHETPALPVLPEALIPLKTSYSYDSDDSGIDETQALPKPRDTHEASSSTYHKK